MAKEPMSYEGYKFVKPTDERFICPICQEVMKDPHLMACCGKKICCSCLERSFKLKEETCPFCRATECEYPILHLLEKGMKSEIDSFHVFCTNLNQGCKWQEEVRDLESHLQTKCGYVKVQCSNKCKPSDSRITEILRKDLNDHLTKDCELRKIKCPYCGHTGTVKDYPDHEDICEMFPIDCPNEGCEEEGIVRQTLKKHRTVCEYELIECGNYKFGCRERCQRRNLTDHMKNTCSKRLIECRYCNIDCYASNLDKHEAICDLHPEECPNHCMEEGLVRSTLEEHRKVCPLQDVQCDYKFFGCIDLIKRKDFDQHMEEKQGHHLKLMMVAYEDLKRSKKEVEEDAQKYLKELEENEKHFRDFKVSEEKSERRATKLQEELEAVEQHIPIMNWNSIQGLIHNPKPLGDDSICFQMTNFNNKSKENREWSSPLFTLEDAELYLHIQFCKVKHSFVLHLCQDNTGVTSKHDYNVKITIKKQHKNKYPGIVCEDIYFEYSKKNKRERGPLEEWTIQYSQQWIQKYTKNDTLEWQVSCHVTDTPSSRRKALFSGNSIQA